MSLFGELIILECCERELFCGSDTKKKSETLGASDFHKNIE